MIHRVQTTKRSRLLLWPVARGARRIGRQCLLSGPLPGKEPVSYTHLVNEPAVDVGMVLRKGDPEKGQQAQRRPRPVSYTHLDVYKRQAAKPFAERPLPVPRAERSPKGRAIFLFPAATGNCIRQTARAHAPAPQEAARIAPEGPQRAAPPFLSPASSPPPPRNRQKPGGLMNLRLLFQDLLDRLPCARV